QRALEVADLLAAAGRARTFVGLFGSLGLRLLLAPRKRREHRKCALEHLHVPAHLVLERAERRAAERLRNLIAELLLLARERFDRDFEIARHQHLHRVAVEADELAQERDGEKALPLLALLLEDDLR